MHISADFNGQYKIIAGKDYGDSGMHRSGPGRHRTL